MVDLDKGYVYSLQSKKSIAAKPWLVNRLRLDKFEFENDYGI